MSSKTLPIITLVLALTGFSSQYVAAAACTKDALKECWTGHHTCALKCKSQNVTAEDKKTCYINCDNDEWTCLSQLASD